jgi:hypothetical protein
LLKEALWYAAIGLPVMPLHEVLPSGGCSCGDELCRQQAKHPRTFHGSHDASKGIVQIREWWKKWPGAIIGVATGPESGVWMLGPDGPQGLADLAELEAKHGTLPPCPRAVSGSGGQHLLFRWSDGEPIRNHFNYRGTKIDVMGAGGLFVAAPSRDANGVHTWLAPPWEVEPPEAPDWLLAWARNDPETQPNPAPYAQRNGRHNDCEADFIARAINYAAKIPPAISKQGGHAKTMWAARCVVYGFDLGTVLGYQILAEHYNPRCQPSWYEKDLRHMVEEADTKNYGKPRGWLRDAERSQRHGTRPGTNDFHTPPATPDDDGEEQPSAEPDPPLRLRPTIEITTDEERAHRDALDALAAEPNLYHRGGILAHVIHQPQITIEKGVKRSQGTPRILVLPTPSLQRMMSRCATWVSIDGKGNAVEAHPPKFAVEQMRDAGEWPSLRALAGVTEAPAFLPSGEVLSSLGYHSESGLLYEPSMEYPPIPATPSLTEVRLATDTLLTLVSQFEIAGPEHKAVWLACVLTILDGPEERGGWKIPDLSAYVLEHRAELLVAGLTILRGFAVAGFPQADLPAFGSFEAWSRLVRQAVCWVMDVDPCAARATIIPESRGDVGALFAVLEAWELLPGGSSARQGITAREALQRAKEQHYPALRDALARWAMEGEELPDATRLGYKLRAARNKVAGQRMLCSAGDGGHGKVAKWYVARVVARQSAGDEPSPVASPAASPAPSPCVAHSGPDALAEDGGNGGDLSDPCARGRVRAHARPGESSPASPLSPAADEDRYIYTKTPFE